MFSRDPEDLYKKAFHAITPSTGTEYPCTPEELHACAGVARQLPADGDWSKHKAILFGYPKNGRFIDPKRDPKEVAREVFDHNMKNMSKASADELRAMERLVTFFNGADRRYWGPDLAVKAFYDLDKVFFCGRLRGHVCLTWQRREFFKDEGYGETESMSGGKCVIHLNAFAIFFLPEVSIFDQMFAALLHEMW